MKSKKPMLLFFTGSDWCGWCKDLLEVYNGEFKKWAKNVVLVNWISQEEPMLSSIQKQNRNSTNVWS